MENIAAHAGVSKPELYSECGDKAGIAEATALERGEEVERSLIAAFAGRGTVDPAEAVRAGANALIGLVVDEPEIYGFIVRSMCAGGHGILDNALVQILHARVGILTSFLVPDGDKAMISVFTHGMFGFVFAVVEAWELTREPPQDVLVDTIVTLVMRGFNAIGGPPVAATAGSA
jgi:AcrR family transcriptional regulator